jgi:molybdopterin-guanine dinucleotide biosynthesis protein A
MVSCIIVAGGKSERMGRDKKFIELEGKPFLHHSIETARKIADDIIIVVGSKKQEEETRRMTDLEVVTDEEPGRGPIMGIYTGLKRCRGEYAAVLPTDTPLMKPEIFMHMIKGCQGWDAVIPRDGEHLEPLHAVYRVKAMIEACKRTMKEGKSSSYLAAGRLERVKFIPIQDFKIYDKNLLTFRSINTPKELEKLKTMLNEV